MDYLSSTLDLLSIIVVVIVLSAIIWAMLRYYEIIEQERSVEEKKLDQETVEKYGNIWKNRLHPYSNQETVRNQNTLYPDSTPGNLLSMQALSIRDCVLYQRGLDGDNTYSKVLFNFRKINYIIPQDHQFSVVLLCEIETVSKANIFSSLKLSNFAG